MNNRENFDMDIAPDQDRRNDRNRGSKNKNTILVIFVAILLMVIAILVYFVFLQPMSSDNKNTIVVEKTNSANQTVSESVENLEPTSNSEIVYSKESVTSTSVKPVVSPVKNSTVAKDLSDAKNDKLLEGAIQFQDHVVMEGETLNSIADLYGLNVQTIISVNSIKNIAGVTAGTVLSLPDRNGKYYIVKKGDMLSTIASDYSSTLGWKTLQELNGLSDTKLDVGDKIFIPDMSEVALKPTMSKAVTQFIQPIESKIIVHYGQGIKNNPYDDDSILGGILLSGAGDVVASSDGKVLDIGMDEDINFVIITHKESYETVYKNIDNVKVEIGDEVTAGEKIGEVGNEAGDDLPVLYFAIRQSGIPLDPESFF
jgi:murein DD-endopeptidase MepM/ murein hydrolase activator NlpD